MRIGDGWGAECNSACPLDFLVLFFKDSGVALDSRIGTGMFKFLRWRRGNVTDSPANHPTEMT